ncbi:PucR family transcriptional regulator [Nocardia altamirensis]|uniref:PucR family transcriptional regulator n=1 Tax=Nocardia altamirensis TaxID=472158 RepID=UPI00084090A1|nr:helix-turn-helix domain-containing protein [Nocardia altamirensis]
MQAGSVDAPDGGSVLSGEPVVARLRVQAATLTGEFHLDSPPYHLLPQSLMAADFVPSATLNVELFFGYLGSGVEPTPDQTQPLVDRAIRLVHDGMPLTEALENYRIGVSFFWSRLLPLISDEDRLRLPELGVRLAEYVTLVMSRISAALVADAQQPGWDLLERQREISDALLAGRDPRSLAHGLEIVVADAYFVVVIRLGELAPGTLTTLRSRIIEQPGALIRRDSDGWVALIPATQDDTPPASWVSSRFGFGGDRAHPQLWIGVAAATTHAAVPAAYEEARTVAEVARSAQLDAVVSHRDDMVLDYAVATSGPARKVLADVLIPLAAQPILMHTLDVFIDNQFNLNTVASLLYIHRNTVTYRLGRIAELTGFDPQQPAGIATLLAARTAQRLESRPGDRL